MIEKGSGHGDSTVNGTRCRVCFLQHEDIIQGVLPCELIRFDLCSVDKAVEAEEIIGVSLKRRIGHVSEEELFEKRVDLGDDFTVIEEEKRWIVGDLRDVADGDHVKPPWMIV